MCLYGLWQLASAGLERSGIFQDDTIICCSEFWDSGASLGAWVDSCLFPGHCMWPAATHLLSYCHCHCYSWFCHLMAAEHFSPSRRSHGRAGRVTASVCYLLVPWETGRLGVEIKSRSEAGNSFVPFRVPSVNTFSHPWITIICCHSRLKGFCGLASSVFIYTFDKNTDDFNDAY